MNILRSYHLSHIVILFQLTLLLVCGLEKRPISVKSYFEKELENNNHINWFPPTPDNLKENEFLLKKCDDGPLKELILPKKKRSFNDFTWSSVTQFKDKASTNSYILIGGSQLREPNDGNSSVMLENSFLLLCKLNSDSNKPFSVDYNPENCEELPEEKLSSEFISLGSSLDEIETDNGHMIVFCDPLYREGDTQPKGVCYAKFIKEALKSKILANPCQENCMNGFSLGLEKAGKDIRIWSGSPLGNHRGIYQVFDYPSETFSGASMRTDANIGAYTGYSLVPGYVASPSYGNWTDYQKPIVHLTKAKYNQFSKELLSEATISLPNDHEFTGFGMTMIKAKLHSKEGNAIIVGAPYASGEAVNAGRIYIFCDNKPTETFNDYLDGVNANGFFGYSLSNMGYYFDKILIAVGEPHLANSTQNGNGNIFLIKVNEDCTFDREPLQIIKAEDSNRLFGYTLPKRATDLDGNSQNDLVVPIKREDISELPPVDVFFSRKHFDVSCRMHLKGSMETVKKGMSIEIEIIIDPGPQLKTNEEQKLLQKIFKDSDNPNDLVIHQVDPDSNATEPRFSIEEVPSFDMDSEKKLIRVRAKLTALMDIEAMTGIDNGENPLIVKYRFLKKCSDGYACKNGEWAKETYIDWSLCQQEIPVTRFLCFDFPDTRPCRTDLSMYVEDTQTGTVIDSTNSSEFLKIEYGKPTMREINLFVTNNGPDDAKFVQVKVNTFGNLKISKLEEDTGLGKTTTIPVGSDDNTGSSITFDTMVNSPKKELLDRLNRGMTRKLNLTIYYEGEDYKNASGLNIKVVSGTKDPVNENNELKLNFKMVNKPLISIKSGVDFVPNIYDNRTEPKNAFETPGIKGKIGEIGPNLKHIYQIEYEGPLSVLRDAEVRIKIPIMLNRPFLSMAFDSQDKYLFYLFEQIKRPNKNLQSEWVNLIPRITRKDPSNGMTTILANCSYDERVLNPKKIIPIQIDPENIYNIGKTRVKRSPTIFVDDDKYLNSTEGNYRRIFQRTLRETFRCGEPSVNYDEPICAEFICKVPEIQKNRPIDLTVEGWLWARTFFKESIPDINIATTVEVSQGYVPEGVELTEEPVSKFSLSQTLFFRQIKDAFFHHTPIWPIIVGICAGMSILGIIAATLYRLGFFKRKKRRELLRRERIARGLSPETAEETNLAQPGPSEPRGHWHDNTIQTDDEIQPIHSGLGKQTNPVKENKIRQQKIKNRDKVSIVYPADMSPLM